MALSKPSSLLSHLKTLTHLRLRRAPPALLSLPRHLSFATPEEAAAERRRRKRRLRIEPPPSALRPTKSSPQRRPQTPIPNPNPNAPKLPDHASALAGKRLDLHNRILTLVRQNDLHEAALLTRHSIYSNCRPTVFTCNAVMAALLRQSKYSDLLSLHRFITQAGVVPNVITHNLLINVYCDARKIDTALDHYKLLVNDAPFNPSKSTYRILVKGCVDCGRIDKGLELNAEMGEKGLGVDCTVYSYLMLGMVKSGDFDGVLGLFEELKERLGGFVEDGVVYGAVMKAYFLKGMDGEAMAVCEEAVGEGSRVRMGAVAYNSVLDALCKNGKFEEAVRLFDRIMEEHCPPKRISVNLGTFNVLSDGYCAQGKFKNAIEVFRRMVEKRCTPDTMSYNNLIEQLCKGGMLGDAEEIYGEMGEKGANPDEFTHVLLMDACFAENQPDDAVAYFNKMVESGLKPNLAAYNKVIEGLVEVKQIDEAKGFFDQMVEKLKLEPSNYQYMLKALIEEGKLDEMLKVVDGMLDDEDVGLPPEINELVTDALKTEGREGELVSLLEEKERKKAEALAKKAEEERAKAEALAKKAEEEKAKAESLTKLIAMGGSKFPAIGSSNSNNNAGVVEANLAEEGASSSKEEGSKSDTLGEAESNNSSA